jgi:hypothetical protein
MSAIANAIERLDRVKDPTLLWVNGAVAAFVLLAHGGAIVLDRLGKAPAIADQVPYLYASASLAIVGLLMSIGGLVVSGSRATVLKVQTLLLFVLALCGLYFAFDAIVFGPAPNIHFSWNPLLFAFLLAYPIYMARRTLIAHSKRDLASWQFAPVWAVACSFLISALVIWRAWNAQT